MTHISDTDLILRTHPSCTVDRPWQVIYRSGTEVVIRAGNSKTARTYAREYGHRILHGDIVVSVHLLR